jgi:hypothetical protein
MDDMRSEIRAAFEKEQAAHPPGGGLRTNLVSAAATQTRPTPNVQWIAVAVAAVLGLLIVAGLMSTRLGPRANVPGDHKASSVRLSSPTPGVDYGTPPSGVPLLYVHDPNNASWLIGYDWSGKPRGTVKLPADLGQDPSAVKMTPDGSGFEVGGTYKGGTGVFLDALGQPITSETGTPDLVGAMWADDLMHQCVLTFSSTYVWRLGTQLPGHTLSPVAVIARDKGAGQSGISLEACSVRTDRAILVRTVISWPAEIWVVRLSDGKILSHHSYQALLLASVVASSDASYVAENTFDTVHLGAPQKPGVTRIRRVSDWVQVATIGPRAVYGFNGDDSLVLVASSFLVEVQSGLTVIDWRSGAAIWRNQGSEVVDGLISEPGGRGFALALTAPDQILLPVRDIVIVRGDGSETKIPGRYVPAW